MNDDQWLARQFEENRDHLRVVAQRMLGSSAEAEDAVQEAWLRFSRSDTREVENLGGWLTTVVARVCLDALRSRQLQDRSLEAQTHSVRDGELPDAEKELLLADSIGAALGAVLDALEPAERVAFVLHDMFDLPFEEIGPIVGRTPAATRQLDSRARRRVRGGPTSPDEELRGHREVVSAFFAASREGNFEALLTVLAPNVVFRADEQTVSAAAANKWGGAVELASELHGVRAIAATFKGRPLGARPALIDGMAGAIWAQGERTLALWEFTIDGGQIVEITLSMEPERLAQARVVTQ